MGKPAPSKKRKTVVVLSSGDEESGERSTKLAKPTRSRPSTEQKTINAVLKDTSASPQSRRTRSKRPHQKSEQDVGEDNPKPAQPASKSKPTKAKPIYSFFNAVTEKQHAKSSQNQGEQAPKKVEEVEEDLIQDDDSQDDVSGVESKSPLPSRHKRKSEAVEENQFENSALFRGSQIFRRISSTDSNAISKAITAEEDKRPWTERFCPLSLEELAVHKKKVQDVRNWLLSVTSGVASKSLLILKGPAGSGKTTALSMIVKEMGHIIQEWRNPSRQSMSDEGYLSMAAQFSDFVGRTATFGTLTMSGQPARTPESQNDNAAKRGEVILIEEFPNTYARTSTALQSFRTAVLHFLYASTPKSFFTQREDKSKGKVPVVMIISETLLSTATAAADSFTVHRLLGPDILTHPGVTVIEFNPVAPTIMAKALDLVLRKESRKSGRRKAPGPAVLKHLAELGDVRSAISSLEFLCLKGDDDGGWSGKITFVKGKNSSSNNPATKTEVDSLEAITQRENAIGIFHAVGKVVHNKRETPSASDAPTPQPPAFLPQHARSKVSEVKIETLLNELGTDVQIFIAALHENYALSCGGLTAEDTLDSINNCMDNLSDADVLCPDRFGNAHKRRLQSSTSDSLRQDEMSFQTSVRGLLFHLPHPVKRLPMPSQSSELRGRSQNASSSGSFQMFYPRSQQLWRRVEEKEDLLELLITKMQNQRPLAKRTAASSDEATSGGVDTWRRHQPFSGFSAPPAVVDGDNRGVQSADDAASEHNDSGLRTVNKVELLLERLPYMVMIAKKTHAQAANSLLRDIEKLTRISGTVPKVNEEEIDGDEAAGSGEQWSTDKPTDDLSSPRKKSRFETKRQGIDTVVGLKDRTEQLVLSDDDIMDD